MKAVSRDIGWLVVGRLGMLGVTLLTEVLLARLLHPSDRGLLEYIGTVALIGGFLASGGIDYMYMRVSVSVGMTKRFAFRLFMFTLLMIIMVSALGASMMGWISTKDFPAYLFFIVIFVEGAYFACLNFVFANMGARQYAIFRFLRRGIYAGILLFYLLSVQLGWWVILPSWGMLLAISIVCGASVALLMLPSVLQGRNEYDKEATAQQIRHGFRANIASGIGGMLFRVDDRWIIRGGIVLAGAVLPANELGVFTLAIIIADLSTVIADSTAFALYRASEHAGSGSSLGFVMRFSVTVNLLGALILSIAGEHIIGAVFGKSYIGAAQPAAILLVGVIGVSYLKIFTGYSVNISHVKPALVFSGISSVLLFSAFALAEVSQAAGTASLIAIVWLVSGLMVVIFCAFNSRFPIFLPRFLTFEDLRLIKNTLRLKGLRRKNNL